MGDIQRGLTRSPETLREALCYRTGLSRRVSAFFERHDFLICPATQATPFPATEPWRREIDGRPLRLRGAGLAGRPRHLPGCRWGCRWGYR